MNMTDENLTIEELAADVAVRRLSTTIHELRHDLPHASDETLCQVRDILHWEARQIIRNVEYGRTVRGWFEDHSPAPLDELFGFEDLTLRRDGGECK